MPATTFPSRRLPFRLLASLVVLLSTGSIFVSPAAAQDSVPVGRVSLVAEPDSGIDINAIAADHGPAITGAWPQFAALFGADPETALTITFVKQAAPEAIADLRWVTDFAWVTPDGAEAIVVAGRFLALTPIEAGNVLRNLTSRSFIHTASNGNAPPGLVDGIARYIETPVVAQQARLGSLVQGLDQAGILPSWEQILLGTAPDLEPEVQTATAYAFVAFITERYGVEGLRSYVRGFATGADWETNLIATIGPRLDTLESAWQQFLPRWFAAGWRQNAVSAFDLSRAQALFARGAYEAAAAEAERSQRLFTALDDEIGLSQVETLLALCAIGLQADSIMADTELAIEAHEYDTAVSLLANAEDLYSLLPDEHRPGAMLDDYRRLAETGLTANADLLEAERLAGNWLQVTTAREHAVAAGNAFAYLGDTTALAEATALTDTIDLRIQRMVFVLSALVIALMAWLGTWIWQRAPARLQWPEREPGQGRVRPSGEGR